jgi:acyl-CoA thioester hydrolase
MAQEYTTTIELRFSDLDAFNHVNSAVYFTYLETARLKLFGGPFRELMAQGIFIVVASASCEFKVPITLEDTLEIAVQVARIGGASFDLEYRLHNGSGNIFATAKTTMVCFDNRLKTAVSVPAGIKAMA